MEGERKMEGELSLEEQVELAQKLADANDAREDFTKRMDGFDDFAAVHQHVGENRAQFDALAEVAASLRQELDEKVTDKKMLVEHLRNNGETTLAERIAEMFRVK